MKRLEGKFLGPVSISEDTSFHGMVDGDMIIAPNVDARVHGMVSGDLEIGSGAVVELRGMVAGSSVNRGDLTVYGEVRGFMHDEEGGRTTLTDRHERHRSSLGRRERGWH
jgi:hypothetical protein